ncbi:helix-turn-helix domain-containing protein [Bacillus paranthracis]
MFTHQRQQEIINMLLQDPRWHTLEELAEQAHCAVKTVRRDLHYLKDQLPPEWHIQLMKGKRCEITQTTTFVSNQHIFFLSTRRYAISRAKSTISRTDSYNHAIS